MLRCWSLAVVAAVAASSSPAGADQAAEVILNQYTVYRASPAASYFTPGSLVMGWPYKGVLRLEMVCRNKVDIEADPNLLRAPLEQGGFTGTSGWQFDIGLEAVNVLNAAFGGNFVKSVTMNIENPVVYEYSAEDLQAIREQLLKRPECAKVVKSKRYRMQAWNGGTAGLFQNQRYVIANIGYEIDFNKDNPKALTANVQASITKTFQAKFGLTYLKASQSKLSGNNIVVGVYPMWRNVWQ